MSKKSNSILDDILEYGPKVLELATAVLGFAYTVGTMKNEHKRKSRLLEDEEFDHIKDIMNEREHEREQLPELPVYATESQPQLPYQQQMYPNNYNTFDRVPYQQMPQQQTYPQYQQYPQQNYVQPQYQQMPQQQIPQQNYGGGFITITIPANLLKIPGTQG